MAQLRDSIPARDLSGKGREDEPHVTVRYGVLDDDFSGIERFLQDLKPFTVAFGKTKIFPATQHSDGAAVVYVEVDSVDLELLNARLPQVGQFKEQDFVYHPHATLAYVDESIAEQYAGLTDLEGKTLICSTITMSPAEGLATTVYFGDSQSNKARSVDLLLKARKMAPPRILTPKALRAQDRINRKIRAFLTSTGKSIADKVRAQHEKVAKATVSDRLFSEIHNIDWKPLVGEAEPDLADAAQDSALHALAQVDISDDDLIASANEVAGKWAHDRAAELVGMKWDGDELVDNPNAKWAISQTTRDDLKQLVENAFARETPMGELADQIQQSGSFSDYRAEMIARTEVSFAQGQGNLAGWNASGVVQGVDWLLSADHNDALGCNCEENADGGPYDLDDVPEFPDHPNCFCALAPVLMPEDAL